MTSSEEFTYVLHVSEKTFQTPPRQGEPLRAPAELTDEWIAGEMSKAHYDGLLRADQMLRDVYPDNEAYWSLSESSMMLKHALRNVQDIMAHLKYLVVLDSERHMIGILRVHESVRKKCVNMLFLYGFSRYRGAGRAILKCVARYSRSLFGDDALIMAVNPLTPLYKRLFENGCSCVPIQEPEGMLDDTLDIACFEPFKDFDANTDVRLKDRMCDAMKSHKLASHVEDITPDFGAIMKASVVLLG
jgi:hypothetical protein